MPMLDFARDGLRQAWCDRSGATAIEYALIAVFISILVVGWATFVGTSISQFFVDAGNGL